MSNFATLKAAVQSVIKTNGIQEITGAILQSTLLSIIDSIGADYLFAGVATPQTDAGSPDQNVFYIGGAGTYTNFGSSYTVPVGSVAVFMYNGSWAKSSIDIFSGIDNVPMAGSSLPAKSGGIYDAIRGCGMNVNRGFYIDSEHLMNVDNVGETAVYSSSSSWDCAVVFINGNKKITLHGPIFGNTRYRFFDTADIFGGSNVYTNQIATNTTGDVPSGAVVAVVNLEKTDYLGGYDNFYLETTEIDFDERADLMGLNKGFYIDKGHILNIDLGGETAYYQTNSAWDCAVVFIEGAKQITVNGLLNTANYRFFDSADIFDGSDIRGNYVGGNQTGVVPSGAVVCLVSMRKTDYPSGYAGFDLVRIYEPFGAIRDSAMEINKDFYIDGDHLLSITLPSGPAHYITNASWDCAVIFVDGCSRLTLDGPIFSNTSYRFFDTADIFDGSDVFDHYLGANTTGVVPAGAVVCTVSLRKTDYPSGYAGFSLSREYGKTIRMLLIGNSATDDALSYVPFIMQNMGIGVNFQIGILMRSSSTLQTHVNNFNDVEEVYGFRFYNGDSSWSVSSEGVGGVSIQWALDNYKWDIISLQQAQPQNVNSYQPYCNQLINLITGYIDYPVKFIWYATHIYSAITNGGAPRSEATITQYYESQMEACTDVIGETVCEYVVPVSTAIQNARTILTLKAVGDYASNPNNTTGYGYLNATDGVHLQEGLPCQIAAYTFILSILDIYGLKEYSINAEDTRVDAAWVSGKNIPSPHGAPVGSTNTNCVMAQKCAVMAMKKPYEVTDMNYIVNPS